LFYTLFDIDTQWTKNLDLLEKEFDALVNLGLLAGWTNLAKGFGKKSIVVRLPEILKNLNLDCRGQIV